MWCNLYSCYWNDRGECICELGVASLVPNSTSCPQYEEESEDEETSARAAS